MASLPLAPLDPAPEASAPLAERPRPQLVLLPAAEPAANVRPAPALEADLPAGLFLGIASVLGLYLLVMFTAFAGADAMSLIGAICALCLVGYFGLPALLARMGPAPAKARPTLATLMREGLACGDTRGLAPLKGRDCVALTLLIPLILLGWAGAIVAIKAFAL